MPYWLVSGASGSLATAIIEDFLFRDIHVKAFSRKKLTLVHKNLESEQIVDYSNLNIEGHNIDGIVIAQGFFHFEELKNLDDQNFEALVQANFISQIQVVRSFLQNADTNRRTDVLILGSTSAFKAGKGTTVYGAAKAGMLGFVRALNEEYVDTEIRFWFISTGTLANEMGSKVPNQDSTSLLEPRLVAKRIVDVVTDKSNLWEPELTIRRRHIRLVN
jgi:short-subunit dehydrogenase